MFIVTYCSLFFACLKFSSCFYLASEASERTWFLAGAVNRNINIIYVTLIIFWHNITRVKLHICADIGENHAL